MGLGLSIEFVQIQTPLSLSTTTARMFVRTGREDHANLNTLKHTRSMTIFQTALLDFSVHPSREVSFLE